METTDEGLRINSNMVTDGFEMVFWLEIFLTNSLDEAPQQFTIFSLVFRPKTYPMGRREPKPIIFTLVIIIKGDPPIS